MDTYVRGMGPDPGVQTGSEGCLWGKSLSLRVEFSQRVGGSILIPGKIRRIFGLEQDIHQRLRTLLGSRVDRTGATDTYEQRSKDSEPCFQRCSWELVPLVIAWLVW